MLLPVMLMQILLVLIIRLRENLLDFLINFIYFVIFVGHNVVAHNFLL